MSKEVLPIHGDQHCPGGPDPIPCLTGGKRARRKITVSKTITSGALQPIVGTGGAFDEDVNDDASVFQMVTVTGQGPGIKVLENGLYTVLCRVACGSLATPFVIDINHFLTGDLTYELYSYPVFVGQMAVDYRLAGFACLTQRIEAQVALVPLMVHQAGASRTVVEGGFFELIQHAGGAAVSTDDLSWP